MQYVVDNIRIDTVTHQIWRDGKRTNLPKMEFALMRYMILHPDRLCLREQIGNYIWRGKRDYKLSNLYTHVFNLRKRLGLKKKQPLETVHGLGLILYSGAYKNRLFQDLWWLNNFPVNECAELAVCDLSDLISEAVLSCGKELIAAQKKVHFMLYPRITGITMLRQKFIEMFRHLLLAIIPDIRSKAIDISSSLHPTDFVVSVAADGWHANGNTNQEWQSANAVASMLGITLRTHDNKGHVSINLHILLEQENS